MGHLPDLRGKLVWLLYFINAVSFARIDALFNFYEQTDSHVPGPQASFRAGDYYARQYPQTGYRIGAMLTEDNIFASPDGLWIGQFGTLWIQTDMSGSQQGPRPRSSTIVVTRKDGGVVGH